MWAVKAVLGFQLEQISMASASGLQLEIICDLPVVKSKKVRERSVVLKSGERRD